MALICIEPIDGLSLGQAEELRRKLNVPLCSKATVSAEGVKLLVGQSQLSLAFVDKKRGKPYAVDFLSPVWRARWQQGLARNHIFRRALGGCDDAIHIIDATAGFGQDAAMMASLGCRVTAIERSPAVAAVLRNGIERAKQEDETLRAKLGLIDVQETDSTEYLTGLKYENRPDVVYIDPMFDKPKKSAKSPKEMQLLQELLPPPSLGENERLLEVAMAVAKGRVVVKQPLKAKALRANPTHIFKGQSIRYDVYVVR